MTNSQFRFIALVAALRAAPLVPFRSHPPNPHSAIPNLQ
jgi:hypothetical protein